MHAHTHTDTHTHTQCTQCTQCTHITHTMHTHTNMHLKIRKAEGRTHGLPPPRATTGKQRFQLRLPVLSHMEGESGEGVRGDPRAHVRAVARTGGFAQRMAHCDSTDVRLPIATRYGTSEKHPKPYYCGLQAAASFHVLIKTM